MLYVAVEVAIYVWMPTYLKDYSGSFDWLPAYTRSRSSSSCAPSAASSGRGCWAAFPGPSALLVVGLAIFLCFLGSLLGGVDAGAWLLPLSGLFMSILYPTLNSKGISCFPKVQHGAAAGVILFFTAAGRGTRPARDGARSAMPTAARARASRSRRCFAALLFAGLLVNWLLNPAARRLQSSDHLEYEAPGARPAPDPLRLRRRPAPSMKNQVQLITYADRLGGTLHGLRELLHGPLAGSSAACTCCPFFHPIDGTDAGFDPIDHTEVDQRLGSWDDVRAIARDVDVMADVIVNHISSRSPQFLDFSANGARSSFDGMFLTFDGVFPNGATEQDLLAIYRPRPGLPFTPMTLADGSRRILWTTFTSEQIDIDVHHPEGIRYLENILRILAANGVRMVRLDAVGYAVKKAGTQLAS